MTVLLIHNVRGNKVYKRGSIVSFSKSEEKRLVAIGVAEYFEGEAVIDSQENNGEAVVNKQNDGGFEELTEDQFNELYKKLYDAANKDPLIAAAVAVGVDLSDEDKKKKETTIEKIIEQGFDEDVLEELSKGE